MTVEPVVNELGERIGTVSMENSVASSPQSQKHQELRPHKLEIVEVHWGVTVNTGNYSNVRLSASANVWADGDPVDALHQLQEWIADQAPISEVDLRHLSGQRAEYSEEIQKLEDAMDRVRRRWQICKDFCRAVGLELPLLYAEDLPF
jgi:hypothetical protein